MELTVAGWVLFIVCVCVFVYCVCKYLCVVCKSVRKRRFNHSSFYTGSLSFTRAHTHTHTHTHEQRALVCTVKDRDKISLYSGR